MANAEVRIDTDPVSAVAGEDAAIRSVKRDSLLVNDGERNHGAVVPGNFDFFGDQLFESRIGDIAVEDTFYKGVLPGIEIINRHRRGPGGDVHNAAIASKIRTTDMDGAGSGELDFGAFARGEIVFHDAAHNSSGINDEEVVLALGDILDGVRRLRNNCLGMFPVRVLHVRANHLVLWRAGMGDGVNVIAVELEAADQ